MADFVILSEVEGVNGQWSMVNGQWSMVKRQTSNVNYLSGEWSMVSGELPAFFTVNDVSLVILSEVEEYN